MEQKSSSNLVDETKEAPDVVPTVAEKVLYKKFRRKFVEII